VVVIIFIDKKEQLKITANNQIKYNVETLIGVIEK